MNEIIKLLQNHRSIRKFKSDPVHSDHIKTIIQSAQMASSSSHVQAYSVISVTDPGKRQKLMELTGNQRHVASSPLFLVWCADLFRIEQACRMQQVDMVSDTAENFIVATVDTALAAQNAAVAAESVGLGIVYIGGIRNHSQEVTELLKLPKLVYPLFGMCIGYPDHEPSIRPRLPIEAVYHENEYDSDQYQERLEAYDTIMQSYYMERTGGRKDTTWSKEMADKFRQAARIHMKSYLEGQGFRFK